MAKIIEIKNEFQKQRETALNFLPKGGENLYRLNDQLDRIKNATSLGKKEKIISA